MILKNIQYTLEHRKKVLELEKLYYGKNSLTTYLHDMDKVLMYSLGISRKVVHRIHRFYSSHHPHNKLGFLNKKEMVLDWESARFTKPDKPLTAIETAEKFYPELVEDVKEIVGEWKI